MKPPTPPKSNTFDTFAKTGELQGPLRLVKDIVEAWATPRHDTHRVVWTANAALSTVVAVRRYQIMGEAAKRGTTRADVISEWCENNGYERSPLSHSLDRFVRNSVESFDFEWVDLPGDVKLRRFTLDNEEEVCLQYSAVTGREEVPIFKLGRSHLVVEGLLESTWASFGGRVSLTKKAGAVRNDFNSVVVLQHMREAGDHVGAGREEAALARVLERTTRFANAGAQRRILLHGPPGVGKTTMAWRLARGLSSHRTLHIDNSVAGNSHEWLPFVTILKPDVIIIDDFDRVDSSRLLEAVEALPGGAVLIGTVNVLSVVDPAMLRPGRFDEVLAVGMPGRDHSDAIVEHYCKKFGVPVSDIIKEQLFGVEPAGIREVLMCVGTVGMQDLDHEVARVKAQSDLHGGDACERHLRSLSGEPVGMAEAVR